MVWARVIQKLGHVEKRREANSEQAHLGRRTEGGARKKGRTRGWGEGKGDAGGAPVSKAGESPGERATKPVCT